MNILKQRYMNFSTIALSKGYFFVPSATVNTEEDNLKYLTSLNEVSSEVVSIMAEVMRYGYMFDADCVRAMMGMNADELKECADRLSEYLAETYGDGTFISLFGNFPSNALSMSEMEFFLHQIFHYLTDGAYAPHMYEVNDEDMELTQMYHEDCVKDSYKMIKLANTETMCNICKRICNAQQSLTSYDKDVVAYYCTNYALLGVTYNDILPEEIPFKETMCIVAYHLPQYNLKTVTDILRLAVYMSGGDISLPAIPKTIDYGWRTVKPDLTDYNFKKFSRPERKLILSRIEALLNSVKNADSIYAEMKKYINKWIRLGEILHPGEYKNQYPNTAEAFYMLRDCAKYIYTFAGRVEHARSSKDFDLLLSLMVSRPGEFARSLDWLLRKHLDKYNVILVNFINVINKVSTKVIYELIEYYSNRNDETLSEMRFVYIKGARKPFHLKQLEALPEYVITELFDILLNELDKRFVAKGSLRGKKYIIDETISNIALPKNMRSMNVAPGQQARGTRIPLNITTGMLRLYCRWMDPHGQYDLDLACIGLNENFENKFTLSWNAYPPKRDYNGKTVAIFSGDVRHRCGNSAEYIDVDIEGMKEMGVRYLVADVRDFDGQGFLKKDAWAGIMERTEFGTPGEITWAPDTITTGFKLTSQCTNIIMTIVDLEEMVMYVVDEDLTGIPVAHTGCNSQHSAICKRYMSQKHFFNACSLIERNLVARGATVEKVSREQFEENVKMIADVKKNLIKMQSEYENLLSIFEVNSEERSTLNIKIGNILQKLEEINNILFISYDDISVDYTSIFEWMF